MAEDKKEEKKKPKTPTALKRDIQNVKKNLINRSFKSKVRTSVVHLEKSISEKEGKELLAEKLNRVFSLMDKGVKKGVYKKNKAARVKAKFSARAKIS